jgi:CarboxypepD_reg-like domain/TonB-dependent Receptor Plug Domain
MKGKLIMSTTLAMLCYAITPTAWAQTTQTLRGSVVDEITKTSLPGVSISLPELNLGTVSDENGDYRLENVPIGRHTIRITFIGYEPQLLPNLLITAGKEFILNITLTESVQTLDEVVITANSKDDKTATNNELAIVSARSFNLDDTKRYAGALGDPSRMAANFAGVIGGNDSRNDIVVRGNSPTGMLWQLEGLNIPNPNHFGALNSTGGPVSMLNNNNLDKSDFMTSAFPAQYGNATAGVFDIRLRDGNNEKYEFLGQIGFNGFELGAEGPISKKTGSSFIVNYRYSTLGIFDALGIEFGTGSNVPLYQDLNFKLSFPMKKGKLTVFGLGGISSIDLLGSKADLGNDNDLYGSENEDSYPRYKTGIFGVGYERHLSEKTFARVTAGFSTSAESFTSDSLVRDNAAKVIARYKRADANFDTRKFSVSSLFRTKLNSKNSLYYGVIVDALNFNLFNKNFYANLNTDSVRIDVNDNTLLAQAFISYRHRFSGKFLANIGLHAQTYSLNSQTSLEPRFSMQYLINGRQSISLGYGLHNQIQSAYTSYVQTKTGSGRYATTNTNLDFTTTQHGVITYDWSISEVLRLKAETYYQYLTNVPVERNPSSFSALNVGASFAPANEDSLVNAGTGRNYGLELTLERFFSKGYYFLVTTSVFDSRYEGSDHVERNTAFNTHYVFNVLAGKEWCVNREKGAFISANIKVTTIGGKYLTPVDFERSLQLGRTVYRDADAFSERQDAYFRTDLKLSYRREYKRSTLEFSIDLQNVTGNKNIFAQNYNTRTNTIVTQYQQGFFPVPFFRYTF